MRIDKIKFKRSRQKGYVPTVDDVGSEGELFINLADQKVYTLNDKGEVISVGGGSSDGNALLKDDREWTGVEGQTTFNISYEVGNIEVFYNGLELSKTDYDAEDGLSVMLKEAVANANDVIRIKSFSGGDIIPNNLSGQPVGTISQFVKDKIPEGQLVCNGSEYSKNDYPTLFSYLGSETLPNVTSPTPETLFCIKAAGKLNEEGLMQLSEVKETYYNPANKPTASDVGALPITGGTLTGPLNVGSSSKRCDMEVHGMIKGKWVYSGGEVVAKKSEIPKKTQSFTEMHDTTPSPMAMPIKFNDSYPDSGVYRVTVWTWNTETDLCEFVVSYNGSSGKLFLLYQSNPSSSTAIVPSIVNMGSPSVILAIKSGSNTILSYTMTKLSE